MKLQITEKWNYFQRLILLTVEELRRRGYDVHGATTERVVRIMSTHPPLRLLMDKNGYEWSLPPEEAERVAALVRANMSFKDFRTYYCGGFLFFKDDQCEHGNHVHCEQCWYQLHPEAKNYAESE